MIWPKVALDTHVDALKIIHKRIWDECIMTNAKPDTPYHSNCVACEVALLRKNKFGGFMCFYCPMFDYNSTCVLDGSLYEKWVFTTNPPKKKDIAQQIRDYKWREEK